MGTVHKLVRPKKRTANIFAPRPIVVCYTGGTWGHCKSLRNAIVCATRRMLALPGPQRANILLNNVVLADLDKENGKITVTWRHRWARGSELW